MNWLALVYVGAWDVIRHVCTLYVWPAYPQPKRPHSACSRPPPSRPWIGDTFSRYGVARCMVGIQQTLLPCGRPARRCGPDSVTGRQASASPKAAPLAVALHDTWLQLRLAGPLSSWSKWIRLRPLAAVQTWGCHGKAGGFRPYPAAVVCRPSSSILARPRMRAGASMYSYKYCADLPPMALPNLSFLLPLTASFPFHYSTISLYHYTTVPSSHHPIIPSSHHKVRHGRR